MTARRIVAVALAIIVLVGGVAVAQTSRRFTDVPVDHPQADAIEWAADVGLTAGYDDGTFRPATPLSKRHAVVFMERFYDQILQADESDGFTRGDMMVLLHAITDPDDYRWTVIGSFHGWTPTETEAKQILAQRWPYITDRIVSIDTHYLDAASLAQRCGNWGHGTPVACAKPSYNLALLGPTVSENVATHVHEYAHVLHGMMNRDRPVWNWDYCWGLGGGNCSSSPLEFVAEAVTMALVQPCGRRTPTGECLGTVPHVDEWLTKAQMVMDWLTWGFTKRVELGDDYSAPELGYWTFDDWDAFYAETGVIRG